MNVVGVHAGIVVLFREWQCEYLVSVRRQLRETYGKLAAKALVLGVPIFSRWFVYMLTRVVLMGMRGQGWTDSETDDGVEGMIAPRDRFRACSTLLRTFQRSVFLAYTITLQAKLIAQ